ncbi:polysaccharide deacetylase family protein [Jannaschia rubra]|uniref:Chitooligosaccharide deacetylase n=1 Tax=Jannaschia rubra TaxID=282197 RepID=A0A0M6XS53_9RHOB|nr:polysaccharide deacetylase family protein [Jannaschia rubra]CTQ33063.1 putative urate catabolism protein [Jannaschia rubra]SFG74901.1 Polysaccharide deacetylase [Jannaschia rubra]
MTLSHHGRYAFKPITERPDFTWPEGRRLAIYVAINVEWFAFDEEGGAVLAQANDMPDVLNYAWRDYGNRVGIWRMLELLDRLELPSAALLNAEVCDQAPQIVDAFVARGDEIVAHGRTNSIAPGQLSRADEKAMIEGARDRLARATGTVPRGYLAPLISESVHTPDLLDELGFSYLMDWAHDEQPVWFDTQTSKGAGRILSVPYPQELNDVPQIVGRRQEGAGFADMIRSAFEVHLAECATRPSVMGIALHPYLMGQAHRFAHLAKVLTDLKEKAGPEVWFTTPGRIDRHWRGLDPG